ncbi:MAG: tRNA (adenosine(37)-N6)-dimethylallyltransferase MiaA [Candidatus Limnocylindrales bacterium]|nr:tRNA (adenosine(37)-N6)-dimethylallyltransferase MiaA [Candidatus Limnocylindrales bacterium]
MGGPTATGKTDLAVRLALSLRRDGTPAEVISADSRQVYRGTDVATAKPTPAERRGVPHHGLDLADPDERFSVADFAAHVARVLPVIAARRGVAVLVGGTGFWLGAIADGMDLDALPWDPRVRAALEAELAAAGLGTLVARLRERAPGLAARVDLRNPRRVVRALEIATLRGDGPLPAPRGYGGPVLRVSLDLADRATHRTWIAQRAAAQLDGGILPEAERLRARYPTSLPAFSAIGYREAWDLLDGRIDRAGYLAANVARNVAYARRQRTWFRAARAHVSVDVGAPAQVGTAIEQARAFARETVERGG